MKHLRNTLSLGLLGLFFASCGPIIVEPVRPQSTLPQELPSTQSAPPSTSSTSTQTVTSQAQKEIREQTSSVMQPTTTSSVTTPTIPTTPATSYPVALPIPGKPGYVYNPYNNNPVYVQGIPSGKTVRDPKDPNTDHVFRTP